MEGPKLFVVTDSAGEETITPAESKQEILADLQRMGALEEGTTVELYDPNKEKSILPEVSSTPEMPPVKEPKVEDVIFTMPGTDTKILNRNGELFGLEWNEISTEDLIKRLGVEDIEYPEELVSILKPKIKLLDWVPLKQEETKEEKEDDS